MATEDWGPGTGECGLTTGDRGLETGDRGPEQRMGNGLTDNGGEKKRVQARWVENPLVNPRPQGIVETPGVSLFAFRLLTRRMSDASSASSGWLLFVLYTNSNTGV